MNEKELEMLRKLIKDQNYSNSKRAEMDLAALDNIIKYDADEKNSELLDLSRDLLSFYNDDSISLKSKILSDCGLSQDATKKDVEKYFRNVIDSIDVAKSNCLLKNKYSRLENMKAEVNSEKEFLLNNFDKNTSSKEDKMKYARMCFARYYELIRENMADLGYLVSFAKDEIAKSDKKSDSEDIQLYKKFVDMYEEKLDILNDNLTGRLNEKPLVGDIKCKCELEVVNNKICLYFSIFDEKTLNNYISYAIKNGEKKTVPGFIIDLNDKAGDKISRVFDNLCTVYSKLKKCNKEVLANGNIELSFGDAKEVVSTNDFGKSVLEMVNPKKDKEQDKQEEKNDDKTDDKVDGQTRVVSKKVTEEKSKEPVQDREEKKDGLDLDEISKNVIKETENVVSASELEKANADKKEKEPVNKEVRKNNSLRRDNNTEKVVAARKTSEENLNNGKKKGIIAFFGNRIKRRAVIRKIKKAIDDAFVENVKLVNGKDSGMFIRKKDGSLLNNDEKNAINNYLDYYFNYDKNVRRIRGGEGQPPLVTVDHITNAFIDAKGNLLGKNVVNDKENDNRVSRDEHVRHVPKHPINKENDMEPRRANSENITRERVINAISHKVYDDYRNYFDKSNAEIMRMYRQDNPNSKIDDYGLYRAVILAKNAYNNYYKEEYVKEPASEHVRVR